VPLDVAMSNPAADTKSVIVGSVTYRVTPTGNDRTPYELRGPRGAHYGLMRNIHTPHMLFVVNLKAFTRHAPQWWFSDKDGELRWLG
jgi:hypothetical protein